MSDAAELAKALEKTSANLTRYIKAEGLKIGAELGKSHAKAAAEQIREKDLELQRASDLIAELKRQIVPLDRRSATLAHLEEVLVAAARTARSHGTDVPPEVVLATISAAQEAGRAVPNRWKQEEGTE